MAQELEDAQSLKLSIDLIQQTLIEALKPTGGRPKSIKECSYCGLYFGSRAMKVHKRICPSKPPRGYLAGTRNITRDEAGRILSNRSL